MVNLVQEVRRAKTLKEEVHFDRSRYGLIEIMRDERPVLVKRESMDLPAIASEILPCERVFLKKSKTSAIKGCDTVQYIVKTTVGSGGRSTVFLERDISVAAEILYPDRKERLAWFSTLAARKPKQGPASAIRCGVVTELLKRLNEEK